MHITLKRDVEDVDWAAVAAVYQATLGPDEPQQLARTWARSYATVLAFAGERLVGTARAISDGEREALIVGVAVLPEFQRQGIGTAMIQALVRDLDRTAILPPTAGRRERLLLPEFGLPHAQARAGPRLSGSVLRGRELTGGEKKTSRSGPGGSPGFRSRGLRVALPPLRVPSS